MLNISFLQDPSRGFSLNLSTETEPYKIIKLQSINNLEYSSYLEHEQDSGSEGDLANFTEETADELLRSDTEEMECDDKNDPPPSPSLSDSFYSTKSEASSLSQFTISRAYKAIRAARLAAVCQTPGLQHLHPPHPHRRPAGRE